MRGSRHHRGTTAVDVQPERCILVGSLVDIRGAGRSDPAIGAAARGERADLLDGSIESDDLEAAKGHLGAQEISARWQDAMAELLEQRVPDEGPPPLEEVFRLD